MTAREIKAFDEMFNMIFDAVSEKRASESAASGANIASNDIAIGGGMSDLFGKLRQHSKRMRWSTEAEEILDKKRESMDLCQTDRELLDWAAREVFQASISYEEEAREAMRDMATATHAKAKAAAQVNSNTSNVKSADSPSTQPQASQTPQQFGLPVLQSPAYPHLIALLIQTFRDKYQDPNLALAIFEHAKTLSIASYVFGCTTIVYNQVLKTRWGYFADLKGVHDALAEMKVNGIEADSKTRKIVDGIRRDIGQKGELWTGEIDVAAGVMNDVWSILSRIEELAKPLEHKKVPNRRRQMLKWDDWKSMPLEDDETDRWGFNQWRKPDASLQSAFKADHAQR
ncbi:hypothetical protein AX16_010640 [Volvariella volvacea WC 439]|nr:hypothetical protein AX16_010640 [Volvariella volvacea WC 439]